ncbi:MAG: hypothetical protein KAR39_01625 [Thermoplasmata archaeon]|nr:hypothetical protein [Thermoplasmata archaeon]
MSHTIHDDIIIIIRTLQESPDLTIRGLQIKMKRLRKTLIYRDRLLDLCEVLEMLNILEVDEKPNMTYLKLTEYGEEVSRELGSK